MSGITRRQALGYLGATGAMFATACTPVKILLGAYPEVFDDQIDLTDGVLAGFADAVLPGAAVPRGALVRPLHDERFPFHSHCARTAQASGPSGRTAKRTESRGCS